MAGNIISIVGYGRSSINYNAKQMWKIAKLTHSKEWKIKPFKEWKNIKIKQIIRQILNKKDSFEHVWNEFIKIEYQPGRVGLKSDWNKRFVEYLKDKEFKRYQKRYVEKCRRIKNKRADYDAEDVF